MTEDEKQQARLRFFHKSFDWGYEAGGVSGGSLHRADAISAGERFGAHERQHQTAAKAYAALTALRMGA